MRKPRSPGPRPRSVRCHPGLIVLAALLAACGGGGGVTAPPPGLGTPRPHLDQVLHGRLVDVYGLQSVGDGLAMTLHQRDVLIGPDIQDQRDHRNPRPDDEVLYDFVGGDPDTLQPRLFIPREIGSAAFADAFAALGRRLRAVTPMAVGVPGNGRTFSVVPRNAAIALRFDGPLGVDDGFFVQRDAAGRVVALRNTDAVQLLQIAGDPNGAAAETAFRPLPVRIVVRERELILDPVLLGSEGVQHQSRNNAAGLPASPDQVGASIRIALPLEGPLALPGLRPDAIGSLTGIDNRGRRAVVRDFRAANAADDSAEIARGFVRDPVPPRIVGAIPLWLERVEQQNQFVQAVTVWKGGIEHDIDRGDVLEFVTDNSGVPVLRSEVIAEPQEDRGRPEVQRVRVLVRYSPGLQEIDPRRLPGYPADPAALAEWLVRNAPRAILRTEFAAGGGMDPATGRVLGDDPRWFVTYLPEALPGPGGVRGAPGENVNPMAMAVVRFSKPVDLATVQPADTFFFGLRNLLDRDAMAAFRDRRPNGTGSPGMDPAAFRETKYRTPHLIGARVLDEDGSQTALRLQPLLGFYLDQRMREPQPGDDFRYWLHLLAGADGVRDLAGNPLDLQADVPERGGHLAIPFSLDTRSTAGRPNFPDNRVVYVVRRFEDPDEDPHPSYHRPDEVVPPPEVDPTPRVAAQRLDDLYGSVVLDRGVLRARPTSRTRRVVDNQNQQLPPDQASEQRWCPTQVAGQAMQVSPTGTTAFGAPLQNPLNPQGCRLQTAWREVDLSLSRVDPFDLDLDVEQMFWAPFVGAGIDFDEFDRMSLFLGHSERRPEPCVDGFGIPGLPASGLQLIFDRNYLHDVAADGTGRIVRQPQPHPAYQDAPLVILSSMAVSAPAGPNRFLPLPTFQRPYFVFRDQTVESQGGSSGSGSDLANGRDSYLPYVLSPGRNGRGRGAVPGPGGLQLLPGRWDNGVNYRLGGRLAFDGATGGLVGAIALPLLADFWTYCDSPDLPAGSGYVAQGTNGWQVSLTQQGSLLPAFRAYSAGRPAWPDGTPPLCRGPGDPAWFQAMGGFAPRGTLSQPGGGPTPPLDPITYWTMVDFLKRASVATAGFVDLRDPHRVDAATNDDPRLGPWPASVGVPEFALELELPGGALPAGTALTVQFRAAGEVDPDPWYWREWFANGPNAALLQPTPDNFPLDPQKAIDAHIRKLDDRTLPGGGRRDWWTGFYNRVVTDYTGDLRQLLDPAWLRGFAAPGETFTATDVRYANWRLVASNNVDVTPPVAPALETLVLAWRYRAP